MTGEGAPKSADVISDALRTAREDLRAFLNEQHGREILKTLGHEDLDDEKIDNLPEDEAVELAAKIKEAEDNRHEAMVKDYTDRLMNMSFAAYFNILQDFMNTHPGCTPLEGFSRAQVEKFVRENMSRPGDITINQFEEKLTNSQQAYDAAAQPASAQDHAQPAPVRTDGPDDTAPKPGDAAPTGPEAAELKEAREKAVEEIIDKLFAPMEGMNNNRQIVDEGVFQNEGKLEPDEARAILVKFFESIALGDIESTKTSLLEDLLQRQKDIDTINEESMRSNFEDLLKKAAAETGIDDYGSAGTVDLGKFAAKFKEIIEEAEKKEKKKRRWRRVGGSITNKTIVFMTVAATALAAVGTAAGIIIGNRNNRAAVEPEPTSVSDSERPGEDDMDRQNPEGGETDQQQDMPEDDGEKPTEDDKDDAEANEDIDETWDALHGGDARGLWANDDGTGPNAAKAGERNLVAPTEFEKFLNADLGDEAVQKEFKGHFMEVATKEAAVLEQIADFAQKHGYLELLPESIRDLQGEDLENAINENRNGCYDELLNNLRQKLEKATVSTTKLEAGTYSNYYAHMINPDGLATKDNLELETCTTWENGTQVFQIVFEDGTTMLFKGGCIQLVEKLTPPSKETPPPSKETPPPSKETPPPEDETPPPSKETPPPEDETPPPEEETPPPEEETPPPEDETPPPSKETPPPEDNSKIEEALAEGQDAYVVPVQEGARIAESDNPYVWDSDGVTVEPINVDAQNADQVLNQINYADDDAAAEAQQRQQAAEEQARIDAEAAEQAAEPIDLDALGGPGF